ncbi:MAG: SDR family oxidoreductase [Lacunisphaera sp.]|nr:SDR family oxidoreductase [Lacunisphaera sp.]
MNPWYSLKDKIIWVTGGAGYFGSAISTALDPLCRKVVCFDIGPRAEALVQERKLTKTIGLAHDLSDTLSLPAMIEATVAKHGLPDGVVHLPYASFGANKSMVDLAPEEFLKTFQQALIPTFVLCRNLAERMRARRSGSIILFSSMYGVVSPDPRNYPEPIKPNPIDYGASKAAVLQMSRYLAVHYGPEAIRFNCITPGPFPHLSTQKDSPEFIQRLAERSPLRRIGQNPEIVGPTLFLLTDSASYVTGHNLVVDGGWTAW